MATIIEIRIIAVPVENQPAFFLSVGNEVRGCGTKIRSPFFVLEYIAFLFIDPYC